MSRLNAVLLVLIACSSSDDNGRARVYSSSYAPWSMDRTQSALWFTDPDNDGSRGYGQLILATEDYTCADFEEGLSLDEFLGTGSGLMVSLAYDTDRDRDAALPAWEGLYVSGYAYDIDGGDERQLAMIPWNEGTIYMMSYYGGSSWLRVDEGTTDAMVGEFYAEFWWGSFDAAICGDWDEPSYYYYDDEYGYGYYE